MPSKENALKTGIHLEGHRAPERHAKEFTDRSRSQGEVASRTATRARTDATRAHYAAALSVASLSDSMLGLNKEERRIRLDKEGMEGMDVEREPHMGDMQVMQF